MGRCPELKSVEFFVCTPIAQYLRTYTEAAREHVHTHQRLSTCGNASVSVE